MIDRALASKIPERIRRIDELAHNIWWAWHPRARDVFRSLDYPLWNSSGHNPVKVLYDMSGEKLQAAAEDPAFLSIYDSVISTFDTEMSSSATWFSTRYPQLLTGPIAYLSMEFALHNSLPIYAGGLGILAGDMCKEASDLGLPFIGMGFMYPQGYFHQHVSADGWQQEIYRQLNFNEAPINQVLLPGGGRSIAQVRLGNRDLAIAVWQVNVGRVKILLLDTNVEENTLEDRQLSARLYTADPEMRIQQEIILGIGGVRVLRALGIQPVVWHANEGHSAFMGLERVREEVKKGASFENALLRIRETTIFTTHTPVQSGHDVFAPGLVDKYFSDFWTTLGIDRRRFLELGLPDIRGQAGFNMTALAINTANQVNAVSRLHEGESKKMWHLAWPDLPEAQVPISHITNGVHVPSWEGLEFVQLFEKYLGKDWTSRQADVDFWKPLLNIPDEEIWAIHRSLKGRLIDVIMDRAQTRWAEGEVNAQQVVTMGALLNPQVLTIGFSRRFTEYKRPALILSDLNRLKKILNNPWHPVQIVFAGKSHPADFSGKYILHKIYSVAQDREYQGRIAFVEDYDMHLSRYLTHGIDVWLNNPLRLQEASGTSGMKAAINGVLNLSVRDGWWEEGYNGINGWDIGAGPETAYSPDQDKNDAEALYRILEDKVIPLYYQQDRSGIPHGWVKMIKESICSIMPRFSACRMVQEYTEKLYANVPRLIKSAT
jgi:glycogen phosphorylase